MRFVDNDIFDDGAHAGRYPKKDKRQHSHYVASSFG
jgi:hypothetical protein